jgi:hypothetical protein
MMNARGLLGHEEAAPASSSPAKRARLDIEAAGGPLLYSQAMERITGME